AETLTCNAGLSQGKSVSDFGESSALHRHGKSDLCSPCIYNTKDLEGGRWPPGILGSLGGHRLPLQRSYATSHQTIPATPATSRKIELQPHRDDFCVLGVDFEAAGWAREAGLGTALGAGAAGGRTGAGAGVTGLIGTFAACWATGAGAGGAGGAVGAVGAAGA